VSAAKAAPAGGREKIFSEYFPAPLDKCLGIEYLLPCRRERRRLVLAGGLAAGFSGAFLECPQAWLLRADNVWGALGQALASRLGSAKKNIFFAWSLDTIREK